MSSPSLPDLPPEILDLVVDHLRAEPATLKACCLVSKSWIPRTRRHLFASVWFGPSSIQPWKKLFPDPSTSPAHHTRILELNGFPTSMVRETSTLACIRSFRHIVDLKVSTLGWDNGRTSLVPLHGLSPTLKSLLLHYEYLSTSEVLNLICSFPHLEDLKLSDFYQVNNTDAWDTPSPSPKLTGTLKLRGSRFATIRGLLSLRGLHFSEIVIAWPVEDAGSVVELASQCSDTLESLNVRYSLWGAFRGFLHLTAVLLSVVQERRRTRCPLPLTFPSTRNLETSSSAPGESALGGFSRRSRPQNPRVCSGS